MSPRRHRPTGPFARLFFPRTLTGRKSRRSRTLTARVDLRLESLESRALLSSVPFIATLTPELSAKTVSLFTVQGRYGNNALNGDWELGITSNTNAPPQQQIDRTWTSGMSEPFSFSFTDKLAGSFLIGGRTVQASYPDRLVRGEPNAIKIWARTTTTGSGLTINDLKITPPGSTDPTVFAGTSIAVSQASGTVLPGDHHRRHRLPVGIRWHRHARRQCDDAVRHGSRPPWLGAAVPRHRHPHPLGRSRRRFQQRRHNRPHQRPHEIGSRPKFLLRFPVRARSAWHPGRRATRSPPASAGGFLGTA